MLKITAIGNLTNDVELKMNETTGKPYAILRIASDRRYKDKDGNKLTPKEITGNYDTVSVSMPVLKDWVKIGLGMTGLTCGWTGCTGWTGAAAGCAAGWVAACAARLASTWA